jgi:hypothetical protein
VIDTHATEKSGKIRRRFFFGWYMVTASIVTNTIFSAAYFQGLGVLILPIERTFGWDRWVVSAAMSLRQLESGIVSPAVGFLLDRFSARKLIFWSAVISGAGFMASASPPASSPFFSLPPLPFTIAVSPSRKTCFSIVGSYLDVRHRFALLYVALGPLEIFLAGSRRDYEKD